MIDFMKAAVLKDLILLRLNFEVDSNASGGEGKFSFERSIQVLTPSDVEISNAKEAKVNAKIKILGKDKDGADVFSASMEYESLFDVVDGATFFSKPMHVVANYGFSLIYPFILSDITPILNRAGFHEFTLPLSAIPSDESPSE